MVRTFMKNLLICLITAISTYSAFATTIGLSNHPFLMKKNIITTEYNNYTSAGTGQGITARYLRNVSDQINIDAGVGFTSGERASRYYVGADMEVLPDYGRQPKFSFKGIAETQNFDGRTINSFGIAPTISKGLVFWGKEAFPFIALPMRLSLDTDERVYETSTALAVGITGRIPVQGISNLVGNIEANMSLRNSYTALVMGVSLPVE